MIRVEYNGLPNFGKIIISVADKMLHDERSIPAHFGIGEDDIRVRLSVAVLGRQILCVVYGDDKDTDGGGI
jgi:hypothetical protein